MEIIAHRVNTLEAFGNTPKEFGIELDIRYHNNSLVLHHDPFHHHEKPYPCLFEDMLKKWDRSAAMILNVKSEGIEPACIEMMAKYNIENWFFLDLSMPYFAIYAEKAVSGELKYFSHRNLAVRFSEREPIEYAASFRNKAGWVWVDCFTKMPLERDSYNILKSCGYKICLVAPELQKHPAEWASDFLRLTEGMDIDAVCTKRPDLWQK